MMFGWWMELFGWTKIDFFWGPGVFP